MFASAGGKKEQLGEKIQRVKGVLEHIGLYVGLACYTAIGAKVFQELENPHEVDTLETYQALLISKREVFLSSFWNESSNGGNYTEVVESANKYRIMNIVMVSQDFTISWKNQSSSPPSL